MSLTNAQSAVFTPRTLGPACPTTFSVNDNGDASDATPGDGVCATATGSCTLRAAIEEANAFNSCGAIDIYLSVNISINLGAALPDINHNININGPGASVLTVQRSTAGGTPNFRIFTINSGKTVNISALTLANGNPSSGNGGGVSNSGNLALSNLTLTGNAVNSGIGGGAIFNDGYLTMTNVTVSANSAMASSTAAGILNSGTLTVTTSTVRDNNAASYGCGGFSNNGTLAGHVQIGDRAVMGGLTAVHQFCRIGRLAITGGCSKIVQDVPPFMIADGNPAAIRGINLVGLERNNFTGECVKSIKEAFRLIYRCKYNTRQALEAVRSELAPCDEIKQIIDFIESSERGITR